MAIDGIKSFRFIRENGESKKLIQYKLNPRNPLIIAKKPHHIPVNRPTV